MHDKESATSRFERTSRQTNTDLLVSKCQILDSWSVPEDLIQFVQYDLTIRFQVSSFIGLLFCVINAPANVVVINRLGLSVANFST